MNLNARLLKIEAKVLPPTPADGRPNDDEIWKRFPDCLAQIERTMAPEHIQHVFEQVNDLGDDAWEQGKGSALTFAVLHIAWWAAESWPEPYLKPLAMPPAVAQVLLDFPDVDLTDHCLSAACGYRLPYRSYRTRGARGFQQSLSFFDECPICGGPVTRYGDRPVRIWLNATQEYFTAGDWTNAPESAFTNRLTSF